MVVNVNYIYCDDHFAIYKVSDHYVVLLKLI